MHLILEYLPLVLFFVVYKTVDIYWATGAIIVAMSFQTLVYLFQKKPIPTRHWVIFASVAIFGGLTIMFQNDTFIKWKVTVIYALFSVVLLASDFVFKKNIIQQFLSEAMELPSNIWRNLNLSWAIFFLTLAVVNIYIAYNYSLETWVNFKVFGTLIATFVFAIGSIACLYKYFPDDAAETEKNENTENNS